MINTLVIISEILLSIISIGSLGFGVYLRRRLNLRKKEAKSLQITIKYERKIVDRGQVVYRPNTPAQKIAKHRIHVSPTTNYAYVFKANYSDLLNGCLK